MDAASYYYKKYTMKQINISISKIFILQDKKKLL